MCGKKEKGRKIELIDTPTTRMHTNALTLALMQLCVLAVEHLAVH